MSAFGEKEMFMDFSSDDDVIDPTFSPKQLSRKRSLNMDILTTPKKARTKICRALILGPKFYSSHEETWSGNKINISAKCVECGQMIKGSREVTSNFVKHIRVRHSQKYSEYQFLKTGKHNLSDQEEFSSNLIRMIVDAGLPASLVERPSFVRAVTSYKPGLKIMSRKTLMAKLDEEYASMVYKIKEEINHTKFFCTTADIWSCTHRSFFGYTCHWLTEKFERKSAALACKRLTGVHSAEKLSQMMMEINSAFGLDRSNIVMTATDNGSNFVKAFKEHGVQLDTNEEDDDELHSFSSECFLPQHQRCASHTLNLLATSDFMKVLESNQALYLQHTEVIGKCNALWKKTKWPKSAEKILSSLGSALLVPVVTRWNSLYDAVLRLLGYKAKLNELCNDFDLPTFTSKDFAYLEQYILLLKPIASVLDDLQEEVDMKYGCLLPSLLTLSNKLMKLSMCEDIPLFNSVAMMLDQKLRLRFAPYFTLDPSANIAIAAAVLTPDVKTDSVEALQDTIPGLTVESVNNRVIHIIVTSLSEDKNVMENITKIARYPPRQRTKYDFKPSGGGNDSNATAFAPQNADVQAAIANQYYAYLNDQTMTEGNWARYPLLKEAFVKFNTPLPSSAPVERLFSFAGIINSPRTDFSFEKFVLMKANSAWL